MAGPHSGRPAPRRTHLRVVTHNVNGMRALPKRRALFDGLLRGGWDAAVLTETHTAADDDVDAWLAAARGSGHPFDGRAFWAHGRRGSRGVAILLGTNICSNSDDAAIEFSDATDGGDDGGRVLRVGWRDPLTGERWSLVGVYAPNDEPGRREFFAADGPLSRALAAGPAAAAVVIAGDFNCVMDPADSSAATAVDEAGSGSASALRSLLAGAGLADAWLEGRAWAAAGQRRGGRVPAAGGAYTFFAATGSARRLDRIYISDSLVAARRLASCTHLPLGDLPGDHCGVSLALDRGAGAAGAGVGAPRWRLPLELLDDPGFVDAVREVAQDRLGAGGGGPAGGGQGGPSGGSSMARWLAFKRQVRHVARDFAARRKRALNRRRQELAAQVTRASEQHHAAAERAASRAATAPDHSAAEDAARRVRAAAEELRAFCAGRAEVNADTAEAAWHEFGEAPTAWFHRLGERRAPLKPMTAIVDPSMGERVVADSPLAARRAADIAANFFDGALHGGLFSPPTIDHAQRSEMLDCIDRTLTPEQAGAAEGPSPGGALSTDELLAALKTTQRGKSPGLDGLPYEFYTAFWGDIADAFTAATNDTYTDTGADPAYAEEFTEGLISLIYKGKPSAPLPEDAVSSYRPITLLNADYKIIAKAVTQRLARVVGQVIDDTQTAFVPGRWIGDNILCHLDIFDYVSAPESACVLFLDFDKAYDRVCRGWLLACMERMGIGPTARRWVRLLLAGTSASVAVAGAPSRRFPVLSGAAQGSPLSPLLYVIAAQPLAAALRKLQDAGTVDAVRLPDGQAAPVSHQHADDTSIHTATVESAKTAIDRAVRPFCAASGAVLSVSKCKGVTLGAHRAITGVDPGTGVTFIDAATSLRHLGVLLTKGDAGAANQAAWQKLVAAVAARVRHWRTVPLSLQGRAYVAKQLMASVITHLATFVEPPPAQLKALQSLIDGYVLRAPATSGSDDRPIRHHPPAAVASLPPAEGGLGAPDVEIQATALRARTAARLLHPQRRPWKSLAGAQFGRAFPGLGAAVMLTAIRPRSGVHGVSPRHASYWAALRATRPRRLAPPEAMSAHQVSTEPLAGNARVGLARRGGEEPGPVPWATAQRAWGASATRLRDLHPTASGDLPAVVPDAWRVALLAAGPAPPHTWSVSADGQWVRFTPPPAGTGGGAVRLFIVSADGRLLEPPSLANAPADTVAAWEDACIVDAPLAKGSTPGSAAPLPPLRGEASAPPAGQQGRARRGPAPRDLYLVGPWRQAPYDLLTWGHGTTPLTLLTVRQATLRLIRLRAIDHLPSSYSPSQAVRPALWGGGADGAADPNAVQALAQRQQVAFQAKVAAASRLAAAGAAAAGAPVNRGHRRPPPTDAELGSLYRQPWMEPSQPRAPPAQRAAQRQEDELERRRVDDGLDPLSRTTAGGPAWRAAWSLVQARDRRRHHRAFAWALMHAALPCNAAKVPFWPSDIPGIITAACCGNAACRPGPQAGPGSPAGALETLLHALLECPAVQPAIRWATDLWVRIDGGPGPPPSPRVWLQGDMLAWQPQRRQHVHLWHALRLATLSAAWTLRCSRAAWGTQFTAADVAAACVRDLRAVIAADWRRATSDIRRQDGAGPHLFPRNRGRAGAAPDCVVAFEIKWCGGGVLAHVSHRQGNSPTMHIRLRPPSGALV